MKIESCCEHTISYFEVLAEEDEEYKQYRRRTPGNKFAWQECEDGGYDIWYPVQTMNKINELEEIYEEWKVKT